MVGFQANRLHTRPGRKPACAARAGFSLTDLLISMAVVAILIALMMPSLSTVREAARKVVCSSNVRQAGLGIAMYADDNKGLLPYTKFANASSQRVVQAQATMMLRSSETAESWDGLGFLYTLGYLDASGVFYCPSHHGEHPFSRYAPNWGGELGEVFGNYQYRGTGMITLDAYQSGQAMVTDGMRLQSDYNHDVGANVLRADLTVAWFSDTGRRLVQMLPESITDADSSRKVQNAWEAIDHSTSAQRR